MNYSKNNGFIFKSQSEAITEGSSINYRCSFPFEALTINRSNHGCGAYEGTTQENNCLNSGVDRLYKWSEYIIQQNENIGKAQCSFDTNQSSEFILSIKAHDVGRLDLDDSILGMYKERYNEVLLEVWEENRFLPLEAFWYLSGDNDALNNALYDRERYFLVTGI